MTERSVSYTRTFAPGPLVSWQARVTGLDRASEHVHRESGSFISPALHVDHMDIISGTDSMTCEKVFVRAFTPETPSSTHIFWQVARNFALDDEAATEDLRAIHERSLGEDGPIVEAIQANPGRGLSEINVTADVAAIQARHVVADTLAAERGRFFASLRPR